jgi:hypothetical protein
MLLCATMWLNDFLRNTTFNYNIYLVSFPTFKTLEKLNIN